jgi:hypothetical protein
MSEFTAAMEFASRAVLDVPRQARQKFRHFPEKQRQSMMFEADRFAQAIMKAQHFVLPDGGMLLDDGCRGLEGETLHLPYPVITLAFAFDWSATPDRLLVVKESTLREATNGFGLHARTRHVDEVSDGHYPMDATGLWLRQAMNADDAPEHFGLLPVSFFIFDPWQTTADNCDLVGIRGCYVFANPAVAHWVTQPENADAWETAQVQSTSSGRAVLEFLEALTCRNVAPRPITAPPSGVGGHHSGDRRKPIFETKILTLDVPGHATQDAATPGAGHDRASPRAHLRRGHIRRLEGGNIWINKTIVGIRQATGWIEKAYDLRKKVQP